MWRVSPLAVRLSSPILCAVANLSQVDLASTGNHSWMELSNTFLIYDVYRTELTTSKCSPVSLLMRETDAQYLLQVDRSLVVTNNGLVEV